jgi:hypothetical protein
LLQKVELLSGESAAGSAMLLLLSRIQLEEKWRHQSQGLPQL